MLPTRYGLCWQEAQKLMQPADKTLKTMALELAEFQVLFANYIAKWLRFNLTLNILLSLSYC